MKETDLVSDLKKWLNQQPRTLAYKIHGSMYQEKGIPDLIGCFSGHFFGIECKIEPNTLSEVQKVQLDRIVEVNGITWVVTNKTVNEFKREFKAWVMLELEV